MTNLKKLIDDSDVCNKKLGQNVPLSYMNKLSVSFKEEQRGGKIYEN